MIKLKDMLYEGIDPKRHINRHEEAEGIAFIREHIFPKVVDRWNFDNRGNPEYYITEKDLIKTFKKIGHHIHDENDQFTTDVIQYQSTTEKTKKPFEFELYKEVDQAGKLIVAWLVPGESNYRTAFVFRGLTENTAPSNNKDPKRTINKSEEGEALTFIHKRLIPTIVGWYNDNKADDRKITVREVLKNLKKIDHEIYQLPDGTSNEYIRYQSNFKPKNFTLIEPFKFDIFKDIESGKIMISWKRLDNSDDYATVALYGDLNENIRRGGTDLSRQDEQRALQFIERRVIPDVVKLWNKNKHPSIGEKEVLKTMVKKASISNLVFYTAYPVDHSVSKSICFTISRDTINDNRLTVRYQFGNQRPVEYFVDNREELNENIKPNLRISKMEEEYALQFLHKSIIPVAANQWNRAVKKSGISDCYINTQTISKHLKKVDHKIGKENDVIEYSSNFAPNSNLEFSTPFRFHIYKQLRDGKLLISWALPGAGVDYNTAFAFVGDTLTEVRGNPRLILTKLDEETVLSAIVKEILPTMIGNYDELLQPKAYWNDPTQFPKLTVKVVAQKLKKIGRDNHSVKYFALISPNVSFYFSIFKTNIPGGGDISINCTTSFADRSRTYLFYIRGNGQLSLQEGINIPAPINKMEEEYVLNFINRKIIPEIVDKVYNGFWLQRYPQASVKTYPRIDYQSVRKNLEKIKQTNYSVTYESKINDAVSFEFDIHKSSHGTDKSMLLYIHVSTRFGAESKHIEYTLKPLDSSTVEVDPPDDYYLPENVEGGEAPLITKIEELKALDYIHKQIIPRTVITYNLRHYSLPRITNSDIIKNLKKQTGNVYDEEINRNIINYRSKFEKDGYVNDFTFYIEKSFDGNIYVLNQDTLSRAPVWREKINEISMKTPTLKELLYENANIDPITKVGSTKESVKPLQEVAERLSKEEELEALDYIQKDLIPTVLNDEYVHFTAKFPKKYRPAQFPRITTKDINKNLKKIRSSHSTAVYESVINDDVFFQFHIQKIMNKLMVGFNGPIRTEWTWYDFGTKKKASIKEGVDGRNPKECLTKVDEQEGIDYIIKVLIPNQVKFRNEYNRSGKTNVKDVVKTLKKIHQVQSEFAPCINHVVYQALFQGEPYVYSIYKNPSMQVIVRRGDDGSVVVIK